MKKLSQGEWIGVGIAVVVIVGALLFTSLFSQSTSALLDEENTMVQENEEAGIQPTPGQLIKEDVVVGTGAEAVLGKMVVVEYTGKLTNGKVFDASSLHGGTFEFPLGAGMVIPGWEQGVQGMKVGGTRRLTIPSDLAYGSQDITNPATGEVVIPGNSTLIFDIKLVGVK
jgi:FKBP-type peptidyl-prolyl cis-trans isomerase